MINILKLAFEYLTNSYSLLKNPADDYVVMFVVGIITYLIAYGIVGWLYSNDFIDGSVAGKIFHWIIRFIVFIILYYIVATLIRIYNWIRSIPINVWYGVIALIILSFSFYKIIWFMNRRKET